MLQQHQLFRHLIFHTWSEPDPSFFNNFDFEMCFASQHGIVHIRGARNHWENLMIHDFPTFSRTCIFFLLSLSLFYCSLLSDSALSAFHLSIVSGVLFLNFLRQAHQMCFFKPPAYHPSAYHCVPLTGSKMRMETIFHCKCEKRNLQFTL